MSLGKSRGEIYNELQGYPTLDYVKDESEKRKRLSDIILFSFKNMYEALTNEQQHVFKIITALARNKLKSDPPITLELLMSITGYKKRDFENCLDVLVDNNLIIIENNEYTISPMGINFVRQFYEDFGIIEDEVIEKKNKIIKSGYKDDKVDILLNSARELMDANKIDEAETKLLNALEAIPDYRIYFELGKVQRILNKFIKAEDSFRMATELNPKDIKVWFEWINMEDNRGRHNIALQLTQKALEKTNNDVSILIQRINILKFHRSFEQLRQEIKHYLRIYENEQRQEESLRILRNWKIIEYNLIIETSIKPLYYFEVVENLIAKEIDIEVKIQLANEALRVAKKYNQKDMEEKYFKKVKNMEKKAIRDIPSRVKKLNKLFNSKNYEEAKKEARKILNWIYGDEENIEIFMHIALRVLLQILSSEKDYDRIILTFEDYKEIAYGDKNCVDIYKKAKKEKKREENQKIIGEIMLNIQECEVELRNLVMWSLDYEEEKLLEIVRNKGKDEWIAQWQLTKDKSLKKDEMIIQYSDLAHLRSILAWVRPEIINKIEDSSKRHQVKDLLNTIVAYIENYISPERQESFHSRLQLYETEELKGFLVDTKRTLEEVKKLKTLIGA